VILQRDTVVYVGGETWVLPEGLRTDGCTLELGGWLKPLELLLKWALGFKKLKMGCALHDFMCRYGLMDSENCHLRLRIYAEKEVGKIRAWLIWKAVSSSDRCDHNKPLPEKWQQYANPR